jgi:TfoX/Sxy family transcriptional regulator of competence genes
MTMGYWAVPVDVLESGFELSAWAARAVNVAQRAQATAARPRRKP